MTSRRTHHQVDQLARSVKIGRQMGVTRNELAKQHGLSYERIRQLEKRGAQNPKGH